VPLDHPLAQAGGALNALFIEGARTGRIFVQGPGAGAGPTAAAVAADIADVMTGAKRPVFQASAEGLQPFVAVDAAHRVGKAYVRLQVRDQAGVIADVAETLAECGVSIDSFLQKPVGEAQAAQIVLITHAAADSVLDEAMSRIENLPAVLERPRVLRVARI
jgi:homoserine dehydrogenase